MIKDISRNNIDILVPSLLELEKFWTDVGESEWNRDSFLLNLDNKFDGLSFYLDEFKGYVIGSGSGNVAKLHKILVNPQYAGKGFGNILWDEFVKRCREKKFKKISLKALTDNIAAISLYKKKGCVFTDVVTGFDNKDRFDIEYIINCDRIKHSLPNILEEDIKNVKQVLEKRELTTSNVTKRFETCIANYLEREFCTAVNSGTNALFLALKALNVQGKEVILPSYVCSSVYSATVNAGGIPVLADIAEHGFNISKNEIKKKISKDTAAIIIPYMFGKPFDITGIMEFNIPVIEDISQALGSKEKNLVGRKGDLTICSFNSTKMITSGTGGMVLTDNEKYNSTIKDLVQIDKREKLGECYSFVMPDFSAALGLSQFSHLEDFIERRDEISLIYYSLINKNSRVELPEAGIGNIFYRFVIKTDERDNFISCLKKRGVNAEIPIFPLHKYLSLDDAVFPNTTRVYEKSVSIPIYPSLSNEEAKSVAGIISNWRFEK